MCAIRVFFVSTQMKIKNESNYPKNKWHNFINIMEFIGSTL